MLTLSFFFCTYNIAAFGVSSLWNWFIGIKSTHRFSLAIFRISFYSFWKWDSIKMTMYLWPTLSQWMRVHVHVFLPEWLECVGGVVFGLCFCLELDFYYYSIHIHWHGYFCADWHHMQVCIWDTLAQTHTICLVAVAIKNECSLLLHTSAKAKKISGIRLELFCPFSLIRIRSVALVDVRAIFLLSLSFLRDYVYKCESRTV